MDANLYDQVLSVGVKTLGQDDRYVSIRVVLELSTIVTPIHRKELRVRLTDDDDSFFLYALALNEDDFQCLKSQQGLLVDFTDFPQKLIELLNLCNENQSKETPKFVLQLCRQDTVEHSLADLVIIETNPFKHLTHLSLKMKPGSDVEVKQFIAKCLRNLQDEHRKLQTQLSSTESSLRHQLQQSQDSLHRESKELESLRSQWDSHTESMVARHQQELAEERQKAIQIQRDMERTNHHHKQELEKRCHKQSDQMQAHITELQSINKDLTEKKQSLESTVKDLSSKLGNLEEDYQRLQRDLLSTKRRTDGLETQHQDKEQLLSQLKTRVAVLEQEVRDKDMLISKSNDLLQAAKENKVKLEESLQQKHSVARKLEATVKGTSQEVLKGNEIIKKLQGELKASLAKIKVKNTVTSQQEKVIEEKTRILQGLEDERNTLHKQVQELSHENNCLKTNLDNSRAKLEESKQLLKTNENVITWLNKQVNEAQMAHRQGLVENPRGPPPFRPPSMLQYQPQGLYTGQIRASISAPTLPMTSSSLPSTMIPSSRVPTGPAMTSTPASFSAIPEVTHIGGFPPKQGQLSAGISPPLDSKYLEGTFPMSSALDPRYLEGTHPMNVGSKTHPMGAGNKQRLPLRSVQPHMLTRPPLMSAYFPARLKENIPKAT